MTRLWVSALLWGTALAVGCATDPAPHRVRRVRRVDDAFVHTGFRLPPLGAWVHQAHPAQVVIFGPRGAGSGTLLRTTSHGMLVLTNLHVVADCGDDWDRFTVLRPEPERRIQGREGLAWAAYEATPLFPDQDALAALRPDLAWFDGFEGKADHPELAHRFARVVAAKMEPLIEGDIAVLRLDGASEAVPAAALAAAPTGSLELVAIYPEVQRLVLDPGAAGSFRSLASRGGAGVPGNSGTAAFDASGRIGAILAAFWKGEPGGPIRDPDPRPQARELLARMRAELDDDQPRAAMRRALELVTLLRPHVALGAAADATVVARADEIRAWLTARGVDLPAAGGER